MENNEILNNDSLKKLPYKADKAYFNAMQDQVLHKIKLKDNEKNVFRNNFPFYISSGIAASLLFLLVFQWFTPKKEALPILTESYFEDDEELDYDLNNAFSPENLAVDQAQMYLEINDVDEYEIYAEL
jgi:hypothetical protein